MTANYRASLTLTAVLAVLLSQPGFGAAIEGTITDYEGNVGANMPMQATNEASGEYWRTFSADDGSYAFADLPGGSYTLEVFPPGFALSRFRQGEIPAESVNRIDPVLEIGPGLGVVGEKGVLQAMRAKPGEVPDGPAPRLGDRPDFSGFWLMIADPFPEAPDPTAAAAKIRAERFADQMVDAPGMRCLPQSQIGPLGFGRFVQTTDRLVMLFESTPFWRQIFLDGRALPEDPDPRWLGHSVGHWDGDRLVVETIGFNDRGWNIGFPVSESLRMTETFERTSFGELAYSASFDDPEVFNAPWNHRWTLELSPSQDVMETVCENNRW